MPFSWNDIKSRALTFSRTWADAASEDSPAFSNLELLLEVGVNIAQKLPTTPVSGLQHAK